MQNKLQELTERLYSEGLAKGQEEGKQIVAKAEAEASRILSEANAEAATIVEKAAKQAEELKCKAESDLKMASAQALQATKKDIEKAVIAKMCEEQTAAALSDASFIKEIIKTIADRFSDEGAKDLNLVLSESMRAQTEEFVKSELGRILGGEVKAEFSKKIGGGFTIGPKDGSYFISLTDDTFKDLIGEYLRPITKKLLFG